MRRVLCSYSFAPACCQRTGRPVKAAGRAEASGKCGKLVGLTSGSASPRQNGGGIHRRRNSSAASARRTRIRKLVAVSGQRSSRNVAPAGTTCLDLAQLDFGKNPRSRELSDPGQIPSQANTRAIFSLRSKPHSPAMLAGYVDIEGKLPKIKPRRIQQRQQGYRIMRKTSEDAIGVLIAGHVKPMGIDQELPCIAKRRQASDIVAAEDNFPAQVERHDSNGNSEREDMRQSRRIAVQIEFRVSGDIAPIEESSSHHRDAADSISPNAFYNRWDIRGRPDTQDVHASPVNATSPDEIGKFRAQGWKSITHFNFTDRSSHSVGSVYVSRRYREIIRRAISAKKYRSVQIQ